GRYIPSIDYRVDVPEVTLPHRKRLCIAPGPRYEIEESSSSPTARLVMTGQLNLLRKDRRFHARTTRLIESKARISREAWAQSMDTSDTAHSEVRSLRTIVLAQLIEIRDLRAADRIRRAQLVEALTLLRTLQTQMVALQSQQRPARDPTHPDVPEEADSVADAFTKQEIQRNNNLNGDGSQGSGSGTEGVFGLTKWFKRIETIFNISNYAVENQVKFATCTLHDVALTWWNSHIKIVGHDAPYGELALLCRRMFLEESDKIEKYVDGLLDMIHGSVMASKPKMMQDARTTGANQRGNVCYGCGAHGHFKRECPKLKNNNRGNQGGHSNAPAKVYVVGNARINLDSNGVTGTFMDPTSIDQIP
nr:hypothetical protein [Tanacetum cinerariifolium]